MYNNRKGGRAMAFVKKMWNWVFHTEKGLYLVFGALTTLVSLIVYYVLDGVSLFDGGLYFKGVLPKDIPFLFSLTLSSATVATVLRNVAGIIFAYFTNRSIVFGSKAKGKEKRTEFLKFVSSRLITLVLDVVMVFLLVDVMGANSTVSGLISQIVVIVLNYILSKLVVFNKA